jgi:hypothetical protein
MTFVVEFSQSVELPAVIVLGPEREEDSGNVYDGDGETDHSVAIGRWRKVNV